MRMEILPGYRYTFYCVLYQFDKAYFCRVYFGFCKKKNNHLLFYTFYNHACSNATQYFLYTARTAGWILTLNSGKSTIDPDRVRNGRRSRKERANCGGSTVRHPSLRSSSSARARPRPRLYPFTVLSVAELRRGTRLFGSASNTGK